MTPAPAHPLEGVRILLVDDDPDTLQFLCFMLESAGARVAAFDDAAGFRLVRSLLSTA
jgi:CheY-like chemotaxis protein